MSAYCRDDSLFGPMYGNKSFLVSPAIKEQRRLSSLQYAFTVYYISFYAKIQLRISNEAEQNSFRILK